MKIKNPPQFIDFIDTTFRDGQQSPLMFDTRKYRFNLDDKKALAQGLIALGVRHLEFFSPVVNDDERNDFAQLKDFIRSQTKEKVHLLAHVRCRRNDIVDAINAGFDGLNMYMGISEKAQKNHGYSMSKILELVTETIKTVRAQYPDLYLRFSVEDCFRTPLTDTFHIYDALYPYVQTFGMPDTVGVATPQSVRKYVRALRKRYPNVALECHFHNDRGLSLINALTAIEEGVSYMDTSIWGMAERSGITSLTGILLNLCTEFPNLRTQYALEHAYSVNVLMGSLLKWQVPYNEPVSLTNRTHTAGVHQKAVINNRLLYEAHGLSEYGVTKNQLLLGPLSGWNLIHYYLREIEQYDVLSDQSKEISRLFKQQAHVINRKNKPEEVLAKIVAAFNLNKLPNQEQFLVNRVENLM